MRIVLALVVLVAGCASTAEYRLRPATIEYTTNKPPPTLRDCIQDELAKYALVELPTVAERGNGYVIHWSDPRIFIDLLREGDGTHLQLHHHGFVFRREILKSVALCR